MSDNADPRRLFARAERAIIAGDLSTLDRLLAEHESVFRDQPAPAFVPRGPAPDYSSLDARRIMAAEHQFATWGEFADFATALADATSPAGRFEQAADAVVSGNLELLQRLLHESPSLVHDRSTRHHHATLLHYTGSNGIEGWRQRTPKNIVSVTRVLLDAGADVNRTADIYGGSTTIALAATSIHPWRAGVLEPLLQLLVERGATFGAANPTSSIDIVQACLANGRPVGAELMARHGAPLNLETAAGVGRLELVRMHFDSEGRLTNGATPEQMKDGFTWACEFGRTDVIAFLLDRGMDVAARLRHHGQTGLHWAAGGGHVDAVRLLTARGAPLDVTDETFEAPPMLWALYGWQNPSPQSSAERYYETVAVLVDAGARVDPEWIDDPRIQADARMHDALTGRFRP